MIRRTVFCQVDSGKWFWRKTVRSNEWFGVFASRKLAEEARKKFLLEQGKEILEWNKLKEKEEEK